MYLKVVLLQKQRGVKIICEFFPPISKDSGQLLCKPWSCETKVCQYKYKIELFLKFCKSNKVPKFP